MVVRRTARRGRANEGFFGGSRLFTSDPLSVYTSGIELTTPKGRCLVSTGYNAVLERRALTLRRRPKHWLAGVMQERIKHNQDL